MSEPPAPAPRIRAAHDDRAHTSDLLASAYADGRLDAAEFDERSTSAGQARYLDELTELTLDLGAPAVQAAALAVPRSSASPALIDRSAQGSGWSIGVMGGSQKAGRWTVAPHHTGIFVMGGGQIDLREAVFTADEVVVTIVTMWGGCEIVVTPDTEVINHGIGIMGGFGAEAPDEPADPSRPRVRVRGVALMGGCSIVRREIGEDEDD